jgi:hypothetical protein
MTTKKIEKLNSKGITLLEVIVSIAVGSIVIMILMQNLIMSLAIRHDFELENKMINESFIIAEQIKLNVFNLEPHSVVGENESSSYLTPYIVSDGDALTTVIRFYHEYDITTGTNNEIIRQGNNNSVYDTLIWDNNPASLTYQQLLYNGERLHSENIQIIDGTSISIERFDADICTSNPPLGNNWNYDGDVSGANEVCFQGMLVLELHIMVDGFEEIRIYTTTILI